MTTAPADKPLVAVLDLVTSVGGVQKVMANLLPRLRDDFRVLVIDPYDNPDYARLLDSVGVAHEGLGPAPSRRFIGGRGRVDRLFQLARRVPWMGMAGLRLRRWVARNRPTVVYFNQLPSALFFSRFLTAGGPALVYHSHGFAAASHVHGARYLSRRFNAIMAVSEGGKRPMVEAGVAASLITVVHNAVDCDDIRRRARYATAGVPVRRAGEIVVAQVGVVAPHKCQDVAIEALSKLPENVSLWVCGDVPAGGDVGYRERLVGRAAALGLSGRTHFLGWREDVPFVLAHADICILPSRSESESFGLVLAEAMALEKPCVGSAVGGIPEVIEHRRTGLVVQRDADSLAAGLAELVESSELRAEMGQAGFARVVREFGLVRQAAKVATVLRRAGRC